jgi:membrane protein implicated in regulation of membrane protease activity
VLLVLAIVGLFVLPDPWGVLAVFAAAVIEVGEVLFWIRFLRRYPVRTGAEGLVGERAEVLARAARRSGACGCGERAGTLAARSRSSAARRSVSRRSTG